MNVFTHACQVTMGERPGQNIFLWAIPRSISTGFFRTMESRKNCQVFLEPFSSAYYFGEERISSRYLNAPIEADSTYQDVKAKLEEAARTKEESRTIFVKDMAYYIMQHEDKEALIPSGYRHAFLFRDPYKAIKSFYKMATNTKVTGWTGFDSSEAGFKELWELYQYVKENVDPDAIVIDAADMITDPSRCFQMFCDKMEIDFEEAMLRWSDNGKASAAIDDVWKPWFEGVLSSSTFTKPHQKQKSASIELPEAVVACISENMAYYEMLMEVKVKFLPK